MSDTIGNAAGKIWEYLNKHGATSVSKVITGTGLNRTEAQRAIGWLAKEGNLVFETEGRTELISLK